VCKFVKCVETHAKHRYSVPGFTYEDWLDYCPIGCAPTRTGSTREYSDECALSLLRPLFIGAYIYVHRYVFVRLCVCKYLDIQIYRHVDIQTQTHTCIQCNTATWTT